MVVFTCAPPSPITLNIAPQCIKDDHQEQVVQFWLRPENYSHIPCPIGTWLFAHHRIPFRHVLHTLQKDPHVPDNFDELCRDVLGHAYPEHFHQKPSDKNWFQFLSELQFADESEEMELQNLEHRERKRQCEEVLTQMEKVGAGSLSIEEELVKKRAAMVENAEEALKIPENPRWLEWLSLSPEEQTKWNRIFEANLYKNGTFSQEHACRVASRIMKAKKKTRTKRKYSRI